MAKTKDDGYTGRHRRLREEWRPRVEAGMVFCWRCGNRILPLQDWDLGHDDVNRMVWRGPEHMGCNRGAPKRRGRAPQPVRRVARFVSSRMW